MKTTALTGISLSLLMVVLVLAAAFVFLYQGRQTVTDQITAVSTQNANLQQALTQTQTAVIVADTTRQATEQTLATVEADAVLLEGELVAEQQEADALATQIADLNVQLQESHDVAAQAQLDLQQQVENALQVQITLPTSGTIVQPNEPVQFSVVAVDAVTITAVFLTLNDQTIASQETNQRLVTLQHTWTPIQEGSYTFIATATNINGRASTPVKITLEVVDFAAQNAALRTEIEANVAEIRGLEPLQPITLTFLTREELSQQVQADFAEDTNPEDSQQDTLVLAAFDFVDRDFDLYQTYIDLYSEQILGYYDPETAEFVVVSDDSEMDANEQWTHAHEFMHALQDQHYQLELIASEDLDSEASAALRSLAEGEAQLIQGLYLYGGYFSSQEQEEIIASFEQADDGSLDDVPPILMSNLSFPYNEGFEFVFTLFTEGGGTFEQIDAAWQNLPVSTEQIIHPDRYFVGDEPIPVSLPPLTATLGAGWQRLDEDVFGEFFLREYLAQQLSLSDAEEVAEGWGGDRYAVYGNEDGEVVMVLRLVWDTAQDSQEFAAAYPEYPASLFNTASTTQPNGGQCWQGELDVICFYQNGDESLIVRAPTVEMAAQVAESIQ